MQPPKAKKSEHILEKHGDRRNDPYFWMNQRENPEVTTFLEEENRYTEWVLQDVKELRESLYQEIIGRIKQNDKSVPFKLRGYYYYTRFEEGMEYPVHCRKKETLDAAEEILVDVNELAKGKSYCQVTGLDLSPDNNLLIYGVDWLSRRLYTLFVKDLTTGRIYSEQIPNTNGHAAWANDNKTFFYTLKNTDTLRDERVMKHVLGTDPSEDKEIWFEEDEIFYTQVFKTKSEKYVMIVSSSTISDEYRFLDADDPEGNFKMVQPRERDLEYSVDHFGDKFYIRTNHQALNFRLMETPVTSPGKASWKEVIPYQAEVLLDGFEIFREYIVLAERKDASTLLRVIRWEDKSEHYISFGEEIYETEIDQNPDFDSLELRFRYSSLTTPGSVYDYHLRDHSRKLMKRQEVIGEFKPENYESKRLFAQAADGTRIPISMVYRKGFLPDGNQPLLLYGYGSYGISIDPYFSSARLSLLDRGFAFAIAHIRGGQEMGRQWYEDGKLLKKKNTFTDFIACAEHLVALKYTSSQKLFAMGGSAGGLLMGAVTNMRPDLFLGILAAVPFVDVITTMLDDSIPLTTSEYDEWGNPNEKEYYDYMKSYSPYDNVEAKAYPHMLVTTGFHDSQVQYWEPAKWVARLRELKTDDHLVLLHTNMDAGHGGASGRFEQHRETARQYAFMLKLSEAIRSIEST